MENPSNLMNFVTPKGSGVKLKPKIDLNNIISDYAKGQVELNKNAQQEENAAQKNKMLSSIENIISKNMEPIEIPRFTEISDIINAEPGERAKTFGNWLDSPTAMDIAGLFSPSSYYKDAGTGEVRSYMSPRVDEAKATMANAQKDAKSRQAKQFEYAKDLYKELTGQELERATLDETIRHNKKGEDFNVLELEERGKIKASGSGNPYGLEKTTLAKIQQDEINNQNILTRLKAFDDIIPAEDKKGNGFGAIKGTLMNMGKIGNAALNYFDPDGVSARILFAKYRDETIKAITGAQMSEIETKRLIQQMPSEYDSPEVMKIKIKAIQDDLKRKSADNERYLGRSLSTPAGYANKQAPADDGDLVI